MKRGGVATPPPLFVHMDWVRGLNSVGLCRYGVQHPSRLSPARQRNVG